MALEKKEKLRSLIEPAIVLQSLKHHLNQLCHLLKQNNSRQHAHKEYLYQKPWYLIIGPGSVGKTSLVQHSDLSFLEVYAQENHYCKTWHTEEAIYIEIAGDCLTAANAGNLWQQIFQCFKHYRKHSPLNGILLTLSLQDSLQKSYIEQEELFEHIHQQLTLLTQKSKYPIPTYLIYTHLDSLAGFTDFFADFSQQERQQACGFLLTKSNKGQLNQDFNQQYQQLLQRFHANLIGCMHYQNLQEKRSRIYELPLQLESLQSGLLKQIQKLFLPTVQKQKFYLRGVFFTSLQQSSIPTDRLANVLKQTFTIESKNLTTATVLQKSYFSKALLQENLPQDYIATQQHKIFYRKRDNIQRVGFAAIILCASTGLFSLSYQFNHEINDVFRADHAIRNYQIVKAQYKDDGELNQVMPALTMLGNANTLLQASEGIPLSLLPFKHFNQLPNLAATAYQQALKSDLLPLIASQIEKQLDNPSQAEPQELYSALKAYLMLADNHQRQADYLTYWLQQHFNAKRFLSNSEFSRLLTAVNSVLKQPLPTINLNQRIIQDTRTALNLLPPAFIAYTIVKNVTEQHETTAAQNNWLLEHPNQKNRIPYRFTLAGFKQVYANLIPAASQAALQGNWVLGEKVISAKNISLEQLQQQVRTVYIADYINWWNLYLYNTNVSVFQSLPDASQKLQLLASNQSPLLSFLKKIQTNIAPQTATSSITQIFNQAVAHQFKQLSELQTKHITLLQLRIQALANYVKIINDSANKPLFAFQIAKARFENPLKQDPLSELFTTAQQMPEPIKSWLTQIGKNTWQLIISNAEQYVQTRWQEDVLPAYQSNILAHYPFNPKAQDEVTLGSFKDFFSNNGYLQRYFDSYLQPFLDTSQAKWTCKKVNGIQLNISQQTIHQMIRAELIRNMFFDKDNALNVSFQLKPTNFSNNIQDIIINAYGQKLYDYQGSNRVRTFVWPGNQANPAVRLSMQTVQGDKSSWQEVGPWALFRLLSKAKLKQLDDTKHFELIFEVGGNQVSYQLSTAKLINPFIPNVIEQFKLPKTIV